MESAAKAPGKVAKLRDFADQKLGAKSHIEALVSHVARAVNRHKMDYGQLRYVFRQVRLRCEIEVPTTNGRRLKELPTGEELVRFYCAIENPMHRLVFEMLEQSGLRVSELCALQVARIDFAENLIFVSLGKGKKDRVTVMGNRLKEKLQLYLQGKKNRYLFETIRHTRFSTRRIEQLCARYKRKSGIEKELTPHTLRHVWNTRLAEAGVSEERRAILAGHENSETQRIYTHLSAGGLKDEIVAVLDKISRR
jgi:integrase/recombinase XerD